MHSQNEIDEFSKSERAILMVMKKKDQKAISNLKFISHGYDMIKFAYMVGEEWSK